MLTPNNRTRLVLSDPTVPWIESTDYPNLVRLVAEYGSSAVATMMLVACARINQLCNRKFNEQTADEIFISDSNYYNGYAEYVLKNSPIVSLTDAYLQLNETFAQIDLTYLQLFTAERTVKLIPDILSSITTTVFANFERNSGPLSLWLRYVSGYATVPADVKYATALMTEHLINGQAGGGDVVEFATQTYREKRAKPADSPLYNQILEIIKPYKLYTAK